MERDTTPQWGKIAFEAFGERVPLKVCKSAAGFYLGTLDEEGLPLSRESTEYWRDKLDAERALESGQWTQHHL